MVHHLDAEQVNQLGPNGQTALHMAAFWADLKFCEWIVAEGVDANVLTHRGESALDFALRPESILTGVSKQWEVFELFGPRGSNAGFPDLGDLMLASQSLRAGRQVPTRHLLLFAPFQRPYGQMSGVAIETLDVRRQKGGHIGPFSAATRASCFPLSGVIGEPTGCEELVNKQMELHLQEEPLKAGIESSRLLSYSFARVYC
ncbi:Hypothetical predicted protein [Cloeon dipterum]|uniref:Uncharacterized protein n=1 Tax=Cloeon dipterum TaxID=197152 RepID=A0A8S1CXU6_9INSE|nr:Hypothetical predicted protein [Cloeon dipterum]